MRKLLLITLALTLVACGGRGDEEQQATIALPTDAPTATLMPTEAPQVDSIGADEAGDPGEPTIVEFNSVYDTTLVGMFYPAVQAEEKVPIVVLMHMLNSDRSAWDAFATELHAEGQFAVLAFDFHGHGDSGGDYDRALVVEDAKAVVSYAQSLDGVAAGQVILIGASIGSDAAVDACVEGCIAAASLSPSGWLGIPYDEALAEISEKPVLCLASVADGETVATCESGLELPMRDYRVQTYLGNAHGTNMLDINDQFPTPTDLIKDWLEDIIA